MAPWQARLNMGPLLSNALTDSVLAWGLIVLMFLGATIFITLAFLPGDIQRKLGVIHLRSRHGTEPAHTLLGRFGLFMIGVSMFGTAVGILYLKSGA